MLHVGFYWVKVEKNEIRLSGTYWEPVYFNGDKWEFCGQHPVFIDLEETPFLGIKKMIIPK